MRRLARRSAAWLLALGSFAILSSAAPGGAAPRAMVGALGVVNPDVAPPGLVDAGLGAFGKRFGSHPPTAGWKTITVAGATAGTFPGRAIQLAANVLNFQGGDFRDFLAFPGIAQSTKTFLSVQQAATFMNGGGALAACPGPGCFASGMGTAISFCPPLSPDPLAPAPGTVMAPVGNWNCATYPAAGAGNRGIRLSISNSPGARRFGGTLGLLRSHRSTVWRVLEEPATPMALGVVERSWMTGPFMATGGGPNFALHERPGHAGPHLFARLDARGAVTATAGCTHGAGTIGVGKTFMFRGPGGPFVPITGPGQDCGTDATPAPPGHGFGFRMTTGTLSGSDFFPFLDATTALGTPFQPVFRPGEFGRGMFFTRMGGDTVTTGGIRNIVMLGGGIAYDPESGNAYFGITDLRMQLIVPEPAAIAGLLVGIAFVGARARARRRR